MTDEALKRKVEAIQARVDRGSTEGERQAARTVLERLLAKHGLDINDVIPDPVKALIDYTFQFKNTIEQQILVQCLFAATGGPAELGAYVMHDYTARGKRKASGVIKIKLDLYQHRAAVKAYNNGKKRYQRLLKQAKAIAIRKTLESI